MSAPKHTPGPWSVAQSFRPGAQFTIRATLGKSTPFVVAETACLHPTWGDELANAALIASAPELAARIAALESLLTEKQRQCDQLPDACRAISESVPCQSDHCRHYGLAHGKPCDVEAIRLVRAALGERRTE